MLRAHLARHLLKGVDDQHVFGAPRMGGAHQRARPQALGDAARGTAQLRSFAIAAGLNAKTLSTYMRHANIKITLDLYGT